MWIRASGKVSENVSLITTAISTHLLISDDLAAIVDTSVSAVYERFLEELTDKLDPGVSLRYILLTHAHFDHVGCVPYIRKYVPDVEIVALPALAEVLNDGNRLKELYQKNIQCAEAMNVDLSIGESEWCEAFKVDRILGDGDSLPLGEDVEVKLLACPGHTAESTAYFARPDMALAAGESLGAYYGRDQIVSCFGSSYTEYIDSLDKLSSLDVRVLGLSHNGVLSGDMAGKYLVDLRVEAERFYTLVKDRIDQGELIDEIHASLLPEWEAQNYSPEGPFTDSRSQTLREMIAAIAEGR